MLSPNALPLELDPTTPAPLPVASGNALPGPVAVVLPTYNEANNLERLVSSVLDSGAVDSLLVVDDASPDGTGRIADACAERWPQVSVLHRSAKLGLGTAYRAGFDRLLEAGFTRLVTMDADFSHDPAYLEALVAGSLEHDLVIGSRYVPGGGTAEWSLFRKLISSTANVVAISALRLPARDCTSGFRCYRRSLLERIDYRSIRSEGYSFLVEALHRCVHTAAASIAEVPILFRDRTHDKSKISRTEIVKAVATIARLARGASDRRLRRSVGRDQRLSRRIR